MSDLVRLSESTSNKPGRPLYQFGPLRLDVAKRVLLRDGKQVALTQRLFEALLLLIENSGRVIGKDELMTKLWPDTVVEEANLTVNISALRKILGETAVEHRYIATIPGRGYQFVAAVERVDEERTGLLLEKRTSAEIIIEEEDDEADDSILPARQVKISHPAASAIAFTSAPASAARLASGRSRTRLKLKPGMKLIAGCALALVLAGVFLSAISMRRQKEETRR
jgi:DNA-binding winged helix-turn-helix (wHTH) protein